MSRRPSPDSRTLHAAITANPARLREVSTIQHAPATFADALDCGAHAAIGAGLGVLLAHGVMLWTNGSTAGHYILAALFGVVACTLRSAQLHESRTVRQSATFADIEPLEAPETPAFVPGDDKGRTLVRMHPLAAKLARFAAKLPAHDYRLAYSLWSGGGKIFSRAEYDRVREQLRIAGICDGGWTVTARGRNVLEAWAAGRVEPEIVHRLRGNNERMD